MAWAHCGRIRKTASLPAADPPAAGVCLAMILSVRKPSRAIAPTRAAVNPARACDVSGTNQSTCGVHFGNLRFARIALRALRRRSFGLAMCTFQLLSVRHRTPCAPNADAGPCETLRRNADFCWHYGQRCLSRISNSAYFFHRGTTCRSRNTLLARRSSPN